MGDIIVPNSSAPGRRVPISDTDFLSGVTEPKWRDRSSNAELDYRTTKHREGINADTGERQVVSESYLAVYEMFTQDIRLGNLDSMEIEFVRLHLDVAHDLFHQGYPMSGLVILERAVDIIETSHSKKGWLRNRMATVTSENKNEMYEPKRGFFGGKKE